MIELFVMILGTIRHWRKLRRMAKIIKSLPSIDIEDIDILKVAQTEGK